MKEYLVITIDVEPDCTPGWQYSNPLSFDGVETGIGERLQPLFNKHNITPTYLINNVVLEDNRSCEVFKQLQGKFELGTHLHPEFIEPEKQYIDYAGKKGMANGCFYDPKVEEQKISNITDLFINQFNRRPTSFRAGRFSAGANTLNSLQKLGYLVDTSVTPGVRWDDKTREHSVDFRYAPNQPYWPAEYSIIERGQGKILEVPVSIVLHPMSIAENIKYIIKNKRLPFKGSAPVWLRPVFSDKSEFEWIVDQLEKQHSQNGIVVYNMMFHNVEIMPNLSPYTKTEADCTAYLELLEYFFTYCNQRNIESAGLSSLYDKYHN